MKESSRIKLSKDKEDEMVSAIRNYFHKERSEELGHLAASMILDFIVKELAPEFYNQGVMDSYRFLGERLDDMQSLLI